MLVVITVSRRRAANIETRLCYSIACMRKIIIYEKLIVLTNATRTTIFDWFSLERIMQWRVWWALRLSRCSAWPLIFLSRCKCSAPCWKHRTWLFDAHSAHTAHAACKWLVYCWNSESHTEAVNASNRTVQPHKCDRVFARVRVCVCVEQSVVGSHAMRSISSSRNINQMRSQRH